nr:unnamed protein product [Digitaria exilis]
MCKGVGVEFMLGLGKAGGFVDGKRRRRWEGTLASWIVDGGHVGIWEVGTAGTYSKPQDRDRVVANSGDVGPAASWTAAFWAWGGDVGQQHQRFQERPGRKGHRLLERLRNTRGGSADGRRRAPWVKEEEVSRMAIADADDNCGIADGIAGGGYRGTRTAWLERSRRVMRRDY